MLVIKEEKGSQPRVQHRVQQPDRTWAGRIQPLPRRSPSGRATWPLPDTYHTAGLRRDRHRKFPGDQDNLGPNRAVSLNLARERHSLGGVSFQSGPPAHNADEAQHLA